MGKLLKMLVIFVAITFLIYPEVMAIEQKKKQSVNEKILEILIEKNIITKEQYEELRHLAQE